MHSLEVQRMRPPPNAWREVWDCMEHDCLKEITFIDSDTLDATLDTYLRKHKLVFFTAHLTLKPLFKMILWLYDKILYDGWYRKIF